MPKNRAGGTCAIDNCQNARRIRSELCSGCATNNRYWDKKLTEKPTAILDRKRNLDRWRDRMVYFGGTEEGKPYAADIRKLKR